MAEGPWYVALHPYQITSKERKAKHSQQLPDWALEISWKSMLMTTHTLIFRNWKKS